MSAQDTSFPLLTSLACHDLRTPLATIYGFARTIQRTDPEHDTLVRYVGMIVAASHEMTELLEELAVAARIESGRYEPSLNSTDTLALARDAVPHADGSGETIATDTSAVVRALGSLALGGDVQLDGETLRVTLAAGPAS